MDRPAIHAAEAFVKVGYPLDVEALADRRAGRAAGRGRSSDREGRRRSPAPTARARSGSSQDEAERLAFWSGRKAAFPAVGRISPDYYCMDGTIPRARLAEVLARIGELSTQYGLRVANVFHAGDGNLHPLILYDANQPGEIERAEAFGADILRLCVEVGGVLTGEHGVGVEKRDLMGSDVRRNRPRPPGAPQMRLRPGRAPQPGQGVSRSCTAAPNWAGCMSTPATCRTPICRGSDPTVIPAKAGIHASASHQAARWIPAFAEKTE